MVDIELTMPVEVQLACSLLNAMTRLRIPDSYRVTCPLLFSEHLCRIHRDRQGGREVGREERRREKPQSYERERRDILALHPEQKALQGSAQC